MCQKSSLGQKFQNFDFFLIWMDQHNVIVEMIHASEVMTEVPAEVTVSTEDIIEASLQQQSSEQRYNF